MADESAKSMENSELPKDVLAPAEGPRENLVATAVKFLQNPKVKQSPLYQKEAFLEKKGLTKEEIQLAVQRAGVSSDDSPPPQQLQTGIPQLQHPVAYANNGLMPVQHYMATPPPSSPWIKAREIATTAAVMAAVSYAVYNIYKTYIRPWLVGKSEVEARMERLEASINSLQATITESNTQMLETLKGIQETLATQRDRNVQSAEVAYQQDVRAVSEIKAEISSLKGLLLNRRQFPPPPVTPPVVPAWQREALRDSQSEISPAKPASSTGQQVSADINENTRQPDVCTDDIALQGTAVTTDPTQENEKLQMMDDGTQPFNHTPEDGVLVSQSVSDTTLTSQSGTSNNGFEFVRPSSESDTNGM